MFCYLYFDASNMDYYIFYHMILIQKAGFTIFMGNDTNGTRLGKQLKLIYRHNGTLVFFFDKLLYLIAFKASTKALSFSLFSSPSLMLQYWHRFRSQ